VSVRVATSKLVACRWLTRAAIGYFSLVGGVWHESIDAWRRDRSSKDGKLSMTKSWLSIDQFPLGIKTVGRRLIDVSAQTSGPKLI